MIAIYNLLVVVLELLIEAVQYAGTGKHNWLAIGYAIFFSINAIIFAFLSYYDSKNKKIYILLKIN